MVANKAALLNAYRAGRDMATVVTTRVTDMGGMFFTATAFNGDISSWDTSSVTDMYLMFGSAEVFNQNISSWDTSSVIDMSYMFAFATSFNQDLSSWCVTNFTSEPAFFSAGATAWILPKPIWGTCP